MSFMDTVNITKREEKYDKLVELIDLQVQAAITFDPNAPRPDKIIMTARQKKMLRRYPQMKTMHATTQKMWITDNNCMEMTVI